MGREVERLRQWSEAHGARLRFARLGNGRWNVVASREVPHERAGIAFNFEVDDQETPESAAAVLWGYLEAIGEKEPNPRGS